MGQESLYVTPGVQQLTQPFTRLSQVVARPFGYVKYGCPVVGKTITVM
jgi:hypothetical protein